MGLKHDAVDHGEASGTSSKSKLPILARYAKRHHALEQIIGDKSYGTMTRNKLKVTRLLIGFEPRIVRDSLDNENWIEAINEEIYMIERNNT